jgi:hypothetical protein
MRVSFYVLDREDRITQTTDPALEPLVGESIWGQSIREAASAASLEPLVGPAFSEARETGVEGDVTAFYAGRLAHWRVVPVDDTLEVHETVLLELDLTTLGTLTRSLERIERELAGRACGRPGRRSRGSLRALP